MGAITKHTFTCTCTNDFFGPRQKPTQQTKVDIRLVRQCARVAQIFASAQPRQRIRDAKPLTLCFRGRVNQSQMTRRSAKGLQGIFQSSSPTTVQGTSFARIQRLNVTLSLLPIVDPLKHHFVMLNDCVCVCVSSLLDATRRQGQKEKS